MAASAVDRAVERLAPLHVVAQQVAAQAHVAAPASLKFTSCWACSENRSCCTLSLRTVEIRSRATVLYRPDLADPVTAPAASKLRTPSEPPQFGWAGCACPAIQDRRRVGLLELVALLGSC